MSIHRSTTVRWWAGDRPRRPVTEVDVKDALRAWVREHNPEVPADRPADDTPLIERRYLTSLQVADMLSYIEELRQSPIDPTRLRAGVFRSIDALYAAFFAQ